MGLEYKDIYFVKEVDEGVNSWTDKGKENSS